MTADSARTPTASSTRAARVFPAYLRAGAYLVVLNSGRHNLAITGAPQWRAKSFPAAPPVCHDDAVALGYYQRNWGVADAVLGARAPASLHAGAAALLRMGRGSDTRAELYDFLKARAAPVARELLALPGVEPIQRQYLAEMVLGVDLRISAEPERKDDREVPGSWALTLDAQHPLAGYFEGAGPAEREAWRKQPPLPMTGTVEIVPAPGQGFTPVKFDIDADCGGNGWQVKSQNKVAAGPPRGPVPLIARVRCRVGDLTFNYDRPITAGADEPGNGEKGRKVTCDRVVWTPGRLFRDLGGWNASFTLPGGQYVSASTQGVAAQVILGGTRWVAPQAGGLPAGTRCRFGFCSGWQGYEARIAAIRPAAAPPVIALKSLAAGGVPLERGPLEDFDRATAQPLKPPTGDTPLVIEAVLAAAAPVRAVDLRLSGAGNLENSLRLTVEAEVQGAWRTVFQGHPGDRLRSFPPVPATRLRVTLAPLPSFKAAELKLDEFRVFPVID
ncbi:MAG: hypothetical protein U1G05_17355 [Kiritimatiellia bacterium]